MFICLVKARKTSIQDTSCSLGEKIGMVNPFVTSRIVCIVKTTASILCQNIKEMEKSVKEVYQNAVNYLEASLYMSVYNIQLSEGFSTG